MGGVVFLVTGVGLVAHILVGLPLWLTVLGGLLVAAGIVVWVADYTGTNLLRIIRIGVLAGAAATGAYDLTRLAIMLLFDLSINPFESWRYFGAGLIGAASPIASQWAAGTVFHIINGLAFACAYTYWFGDRGPLAGIAWALFLEFIMLGLYPGWLGINQYLPFITVSLVGHVVYGGVLGFTARRLIRRLDG